MMNKILILDDDTGICKVLDSILSEEGYEVIVANNGKEGLYKIKNEKPDVILVDIRLPDINGLSLIGEHLQTSTNSFIIILTGYGTIESAVQSMKLGVFDYMTKPFDEEKILLTIRNALETKVLRQKVQDLSERLYETYKFDRLVGSDSSIKKILEIVQKVAPTNITVLLEGESGVGKELIARLIHYHSLRREKPFIVIDCGTLPEGLIESEFFGHEKGAFTGADRRKEGQFETANGGTLFLNEVSNLSISAQAKLLRVLQEREIQHIGGNKTIKLDIRIIADTNIPLEVKVKNKEFREDLYHRLNEFDITIPPLRERGNDIFLLIEYFLEEANREFNKQITGFSDDVKELFISYKWPGNIRELKNTVKRAVLLADNIILPKHLPLNIKSANQDSTKSININL
ncbi:MAG: sigma-54 dependent transcriptional regulator [Elusimicrobia bacterium]|nr:sigma-54 dependent transcriptional regulator [Elusimicrobiota bacterium]